MGKWQMKNHVSDDFVPHIGLYWGRLEVVCPWWKLLWVSQNQLLSGENGMREHRPESTKNGDQLDVQSEGGEEVWDDSSVAEPLTKKGGRVRTCFKRKMEGHFRYFKFQGSGHLSGAEWDTRCLVPYIEQSNW